MVNFDPVVVKEAKRVCGCNLLLTSVENVVYAVIRKWSVPVLLGSLFGWLVTCISFLWLGLSIQGAVMKDQKEARLKMQQSYIGRNVLMALAVVAAIKLPFLDWVAMIIPLFFTRISITLLNILGKKEEK